MYWFDYWKDEYRGVMMNGNEYLMRVKQQGSGLHLYFTTEMLKNPKFTLKANDSVVVFLRDEGIDIRKIDMRKLI